MAGRSRKQPHKLSRGHIAILVGVLVVYAVATGLFRPAFSYAQTFFNDRYEDISFAMHPSARYAYQIGERHFDALNPQYYDLSRATYFFLQALKLDAKTPLLH